MYYICVFIPEPHSFKNVLLDAPCIFFLNMLKFIIKNLNNLVIKN